MATDDIARSPRLESLIPGRLSNSNSSEEAEEEEGGIDMQLDWGNKREGLSFVTDLPQRMFAYLFFLITFSFISSAVSGKHRKAYVICILCKVVCQMISFALMAGTLLLRTGLVIEYILNNENCKSLICNQSNCNEHARIYLYSWEVGYDITALSSLVYLFYYSHTLKNGLSPHKLVMSTRNNRTSVWRSQNYELVRNSRLISTVSCRGASLAIWQCALILLLLLTLAADWNSVRCQLIRYFEQTLQNCRVYTVYEVAKAINAPQRYLSPVIVCLLCRVACTKLETDIKLNSVTTLRNLSISPSTAWIKESYFDIVGRAREYCDKYRAIIALNVLYSLLGMGSIIIVHLFTKEDLIKELWQLEAGALLKTYVTYFILISCTWIAIDGVSGFTGLLSRFPDQLIGFITAKKNNVVDVVNQAELNIIAISAKGTQDFLYPSHFLTTLRYTLIIGLVALIFIAFEGSIVYRGWNNGFTMCK